MRDVCVDEPMSVDITKITPIQRTTGSQERRLDLIYISTTVISGGQLKRAGNL